MKNSNLRKKDEFQRKEFNLEDLECNCVSFGWVLNSKREAALEIIKIKGKVLIHVLVMWLMSWAFESRKEVRVKVIMIKRKGLVMSWSFYEVWMKKGI